MESNRESERKGGMLGQLVAQGDMARVVLGPHGGSQVQIPSRPVHTYAHDPGCWEG